jgi:hypothetical protein
MQFLLPLQGTSRDSPLESTKLTSSKKQDLILKLKSMINFFDYGCDIYLFIFVYVLIMQTLII